MSRIVKLISDGIGEAGPKIRLLSGDRISVRDAAARIVSLSEVGAVMGNEENPVFGIGMTLVQNPVLKLLFLFTPSASEKVIEATAGKSAVARRELAESVLQEIGNIFGSVIANSISSNIDIPLKTSIPEVVYDLAGAIVSSVVCHIGAVDDDVLMISTTFKVDEENVDCGIYLFYDEEFSTKIFIAAEDAGIESEGQK